VGRKLFTSRASERKPRAVVRLNEKYGASQRTAVVGRDEPKGLPEPKGSFAPDSAPRVAVYEYALAVTGSATPRRPVPMNSTISAAAIHKRPASMKASK
jgi:hypothetical protein